MKNTAIIHADMNEILFADRNKEYGAYQIRSAYPKTILNAFYITAITAVSLVLLLFFLQRRPVNNEIPLGKQKIVLTEVNLGKTPPPKLPKKTKVMPPVTREKAEPLKKAKGMNTQASAVVKPTPDAAPEATIAPDSAFKDKQPGLVTTDSSDSQFLGGDPNGTGAEEPTDTAPCLDCPEGNGTAVVEDPDPFEPHLGEMPVPMNLNDIRRAIGYPAAARDGKLEGQVTYRVLVDENGQYLRHMVLRSTHPIFDKACEKHLRKLAFQPGKMGDQPVRVWVVLPFKFKLMR